MSDDLLTDRLLLRRWAARDEAPMVAINSDPEVTRFLNRPIDAAATAAFHRHVLDCWAAHGFGLRAVEELSGPTAGDLIGFVGISYPGFLPTMAHRPELGWRLCRSAWGRGFATEAALVMLRHAHDELALQDVISIIHPDNVRSQSVARKLGMSIESQVYNPVIERDVDVWRA